MIVTASTPFGLYCPEHGLSFVSQDDYNRRFCKVPDCSITDCDQEEKLLYLATRQGCTFCGICPIRPPFLYLPKQGYTFCNGACEKCSWGKCTYRDCDYEAGFVVLLEVFGQLELLIAPIVLCNAHSRSIPSKGTKEIWRYLNEAMGLLNKLDANLGRLRVRKLRAGRKGG